MKYEEIYLRDYADEIAAHPGLSRYFRMYNPGLAIPRPGTERRHQGLGKRTPAEVYFDWN